MPIRIRCPEKNICLSKALAVQGVAEIAPAFAGVLCGTASRVWGVTGIGLNIAKWSKRMALHERVLLIVMAVSLCGCSKSVSRTTKLVYLDSVPPIDDCQLISIMPSTISPWSLAILKDGSADLRYGNYGKGSAAFPADTFDFTEAYESLSRLQPSAARGQQWCQIEFAMPYEYHQDPAIKWPRSRSLHRLVTASDNWAIRKLFLKADSICEEHWRGPMKDLERFRQRNPIKSI